MQNEKIVKLLQERFGDPIGNYAGNTPAGVRNDEAINSPPESDEYSTIESDICEKCGMMEVEGSCGCTHEISEIKKKKGLWANIHARRKAGKRPKKRGEKGYPKTLDTES